MDEWLSQAADHVSNGANSDDWRERAAAEFEASKNAALGATVEVATKEDPNKHAEALKLSRKLGTDPDTVKNNFIQFKSIDQTKEIMDKLQDDNAVRRAFQDPDFATMAQDDVDNLLKIQEELKKKYPAKETSEGTQYQTLSIKDKPKTEEGGLLDVITEPWTSTGTAWGSYAAGTDIQGMAKQLRDLENTKKYLDAGKKFDLTTKEGRAAIKDFYWSQKLPTPSSFYMDKSADDINKEIAKVKSDLGISMDAFIRMQEDLAKEKPFTKDESVKDYLYGANVAVRDMAPAVLMGWLTKGKATNAGLGLMYYQVYGPKFAEEYKKSGGDYAAAATTAGVYALSETITEKLPIDAIGGKFAENFLGRLVTSIFGEGSQEASTALIQGIYEEMRDGNKSIAEAINAIKNDPDKMAKLIKDMRQQFIVGGVVGGSLATATYSAEKGAQVITEKRQDKAIKAVTSEVNDFIKDFNGAQNAEHTKAVIQNVGKIVEVSELNKRSPEHMENFVNEVTKDTDIKNVYIDAQEFQQFWQDQGIDINEVAKEIPSVAEQLDEIKTGVGDIVIPISEYISKVSGSQFNQALSEHVRFNKEDMSAAQAKQWNQQAEEQYQAEVEKIVREEGNAQKFVEEADIVEKDITDKIVNTGRFDKERAGSYAKLMKHIAVTMSNRLGITPLEFHKRYNLQFSKTPITNTGGESFTAQGPVDMNAPKEVYQDEIKSKLGIDVQELTPEEYADALKQLQATRSKLQAAENVHTTVKGEAARQDWAAATRIRGTDGNPLRIYRGSERPLNSGSFSEARLGGKTGHPTAKLGAWFTTQVEDATKYGTPFEYHLDMRNPYVMTTDEYPTLDTPEEAIKFREKVKSQGYDGMVIDYRDVGGPVHFVSFAPDNVIPAKQELYQGELVKTQPNTPEFKKWSNNAPFVSSESANTYQFKSGQKVVVEAYHGTKRPDRVGAVFKKTRATSGPMAFFTSSPELASNYAASKQDTSLSNENTNYENWFKFTPDGARSTVTIVQAWNYLDSDTKKKIIDTAPKIRFSYEDEVSIFIDENNKSGNGSYDHEYKRTQTRYNPQGNPLKALVEDWLNSGVLYNYEEHFMKVLQLAGVPVKKVNYDSPNVEYPFVYKTYIAMNHPLVTSDMPAEFTDIFESAAKRDRSRAKYGGADFWDKNSRTLKEWYAAYKEEPAYAWTSIPDKVTKLLQSMGYDGIVDDSGKSGGDVHKVYIPFNETQVKSAIGNKGKFNPEKRNILFQDTTPIWYSALEKELDAIKQNKATPEQWYNMLKNAKGVKAEELEWTGLKEWLDAQKGSVTKEQIAGFIKAGGVQLQEVQKGYIPLSPKELDEYNKLADMEDAGKELSDEQADRLEELSARKKGVNTGDKTKFEKYQLPGGENYREMLLTLPTAVGTLEQWQVLRPDGVSDGFFASKEQAEARAIKIGGTLGKQLTPIKIKKGFRSSHFDEPNILAHIRFNDRVDAEGKKVLFLEEIQSDWHQKGRKKGYANADRSKIDAALKEYDSLMMKMSAIGLNRMTAEDRSRIEELRPIVRGQGHATSAVPDAPFKSSWPMLAMKRMLRYAAENGYDKVAWTTGEQQAERYDLSKQVESVHAEMLPSKEAVQLTVVGKDGKAVMKDERIDVDRLPDYVGKDLSEKIVKDGGGNYTGLDLKVGGEGMKAFYDKMLPNEVNKYVKKWGAKVGETQIATKEQPVDYMVFGDGVNVYGGDGSVVATVDTEAEAKSMIEQGKGAAVHSLDITDAMRESVMQGQPLFQEKRGSIQFPENIAETPSVISLFEKSDLSTILHELGHFYFEVMRDIATNPNSPVEFKSDMEALLKYVGVDSLNTWNQMTLNERRDGHEKIARSFEAYLFEGKAPNPELHGLFQRFMNWLAQVYKSIVNLNVSITPEVRDVFDRMVASKDQIEAAKNTRMYHAMFESAEQAKEFGMDQTEWQQYKELDGDHINQSIEELAQRTLKDMQWLANAKSKKLRELQKANADKRAAVREKVAEEVKQQPVYAAMQFLKYGINQDGISEPWAKLSIPALEEMYPEIPEGEFAPPNPEWKKLGKGKYSMLSATGIHPDIAASTFGFGSGDALVRDLIDARPIDEVIDEITDARMIQEYGDITDPKKMEQAVNEALHNDIRTRMIAAELKALSKATGQTQVIYKAAMQYVQTALGKKKVADIKPGSYLVAEDKAARASADALRKGDTKQAAESKRSQMLNNIFFREATKAEKEIERAYKYLNKFNKDSIRQKMTPDYLEQIDNLLEPFDLRKNVSKKEINKRQALLDWVESQKDLGFEPAIDDLLVEEASKKHWKQMTLDEMRGMIDTVKQIEHFGRLKKKLLTAKDAREFAERMAEVEASIQQYAKKTAKQHATPTDLAGRISAGSREFVAAHRKIGSMIRELDGLKSGGAMWDVFLRPANEASSVETEMKHDAARKLSDIFAPVIGKKKLKNYVKAEKRRIPGTKIDLTDEQRHMIALNWGNEGNRQRLMDGGIPGHEKLSPQDISAILDTLTKQEWDFVQSVWDYIGTYKQQIGEQEKRLTGIEPEWIEPSSIVTKHGTYRGGYFPAKYDAMLSTRSDSLEAYTNLRQSMKGSFNRSSARDSYTKDRAKEVHGRPLLLSYNAITQHVNEVIHRLAWQDWLTDANRIIKALDATIREHYGADFLKEIQYLIRDVATGDAQASGPFDWLANHLRTGSTIVGLGYSFTTAAVQISGLSQSWARIGGRWAAKGVKEFIANPVKAAEFANEKSAMMRERSRTQFRETNEIINTVRTGKKITAINASFFWAIGKMQKGVDIPTWIGAYHKALAELGMETAANETERSRVEERAIALADQAVIDSQGSGLVLNLARIQRGNAAQKLFTNFYSYFNTTYNLNAEAFKKINLKSPKAMAEFVSDMILINIVPVMLTTAMYGLIKRDCDDLECFLKKFASDEANYLLGQMVLLRDLGTGVAPLLGQKSYGYSGPAGLRFYSAFYKAMQQAAQGEFDMAAFKAYDELLGTILHYPAGQINRTIEGIAAIEEGKVKGFFPSMLAVMGGPPKE